jgi:zinc transporter ZupT
LDYIRPVQFEAGATIFREGDAGDRMFFIENGEIVVRRDGKELARLGAGDVLGEIAVVTGSPRTAEAEATAEVQALELTAPDFQKLRAQLPDVESAAVALATRRLDELGQYDERTLENAQRWARSAADALRHGRKMPTRQEIHQAVGQHPAAPLAIWLGILLDGIPESFIIGTSFLSLLLAKLAHHAPTLGEVIPCTLIAGLFLSDFPEALSSSVEMRSMGWKPAKILWLWISVLILTAVGAVVGYMIGAQVGPVVKVAMEGLAAGAMLTMIAQTMIPEAVHQGGSTVVGLSTLMGFLAAVAFKLLET